MRLIVDQEAPGNWTIWGGVVLILIPDPYCGNNRKHAMVSQNLSL
jgi:hypothetical protein